MSTRSTYGPTDTGTTTSTARSTERYAEESRGSGWVAFAGIMLAMIGILNFIYGIAAIDSANFYINDAKYVFSDLNTQGWVMLIIGIIQFAAAFSIFAGTAWGRWVGIATAALNAIAQLLWISSYPFLSLTLFAVDILVIYGLVAYGGRRPEMG